MQKRLCWFTTKNFPITFYLPSLYISMQTNNAEWPNCSWDIAGLRILKLDWLRALLTIPDKKFTNHILHFLNLYLHATNQVDSLTLTRDVADSGILIFLWSISPYKQWQWLTRFSWDTADLRISRFNWLR